MDSQRARQILSLYRAGLTDDQDPDVREALQQTDREPELARWLAAQTEFHRRMRAALRNTPVPPGLKERLLASGTAASKPRPAISLLTLGWALAASVILGLGVWFSLDDTRGELRFATYRQRMVRTALREYRYDILTNSVPAIRQFLAQKGVHGDLELPKGLETLTGFGGATLTWQGHPVAMVCFDLGKSDQLYLFTIQRNAIPDAPSSPVPLLTQTGKLMTAAWSVGEKTYLLAGSGSQDTILRLLQTPP